jgi:ankyrin repeat protein
LPILYGAELDIISAFDETPLVTTIKANDLEIIKVLLKEGANPNFGDCLYPAVPKGRAYIVEYLLKARANPNLFFQKEHLKSDVLFSLNSILLLI